MYIMCAGGASFYNKKNVLSDAHDLRDCDINMTFFC